MTRPSQRQSENHEISRSGDDSQPKNSSRGTDWIAENNYLKITIESNIFSETYLDIARQVFAEFLGTMVLIYVGCMGCSAFSFGTGLLLAAQVFGHISGGHFNPAVTIAAIIMSEIKLSKTPLYIIAQFLGGFAGYSLHHLNDDPEMPNECGTEVFIVSDVKGMLVEMSATGILVLAVCSFWDKSNSSNDGTAPIKVGLLLAGLVLATSKYTGASFNTARSLPPTVYFSKWDGHWVYWVGPNLGGAIGAVIYRILLLKQK